MLRCSTMVRPLLAATLAIFFSTANAQEAEEAQEADEIQRPDAAMQAEVVDATAAVSGAVSVQGFLESSGAPVTGLRDFRLRVYNASSGGSQTGSQHLEDNLFVDDGVFSIEADFGIADFWSGDRWIEIGIRDAVSTGSYEILSPRTTVVAAPLALALPGVYASQAGNFVGIGRSNKIGREYFGVHAPVSDGSYGGMYVNTQGASGWPFYGYATGNSADMWHYFDGQTGRWHLHNSGRRLTVESTGDVGIGVTNPTEILHVGGSDADILIGDPSVEHMLLEGNIGDGAIARFYNSNDAETVRINSHGTDQTGQILMYTPDGLTRTVNINAVEAAGQGSQITLYNGNGTATVEIDADFGSGTGQSGRITVDELELNGSDLAEHFDIQPNSGLPEPEPGMVVSIDPDHPGDLMLSRQAYDRKVVGVISGAGDIRTGIYMSQRGTIADGAHPVAVAGRVYVKANTDNGSIRPGDMLTTSRRAGQATRVADYDRARGAVLGKAMTPLESGTGLVLLFISQQ